MKTNDKNKRAALPKRGLSKKKVLQMIRGFGKDDPDYKKMKTWSLVYYLGKEHTDFLKEAYGEYFSANGLNPTVFHSLKTFENEVISMTADMLHGDDSTCGVVTAGGTESCLLAVKTYRDMARAKKPWIRKPEMVIPVTAHVAWEKGAEYFNVKPVRVPLDDNYMVDVKAAKKLINRNTVMILGSAPEYPHGIIDPIEELGALAQKKNIPLHVDACVGGYLLPFLEKLDYPIPPWDFRIEGVTSISADTHKYGFSAKGASTIIYRNINIMKHQLFVYENWPGGIFASPALLGTRPGGAYAAAWGAMMAIGEDGYLKQAARTRETTEKLIEGINAIDGLEVIGTPLASLFSYCSTDPKINIFAVGDQMENAGWQLDRLQRPEALHAMVTPLHSSVVKKYISDLKKSVTTVRKNPKLAETGGAAMYGMIANIPMRGMVKKNVLKIFMDMYGPEGKMVDPASISMDGEAGTEEEAKKDIAMKAALLFIKLKKKFKR